MIYIRLKLLLAAISYAVIGRPAVIEGVALENKTGKPLARARITLEPLKAGSAPPAVFSDSKGNFRFASLGAGSYRLMGEKTGFAAARFGQSRYNSTGSPILVAEDSHFFAQLRLQRPGQVTGSILDENGVGMAAFAVSAYRVGVRPRLVASANTDDRGVYRFPALGPGRYALVTAARILEDGRALIPTFYGGALRLAEARLIDVQLDGDSTGIDLAPLEGRLNTIRGKVNAAGILAVQMLGDLGMQEKPVSDGGSFEFQGIPDGTYTFVAGRGGAEPISGMEQVTVAGEDRFVDLKLAASPFLRLSCTATDGKPSVGNLALFLERDRVADNEERRLDCGKAFQLPAGLWRLRPLPLSNAYLQTLSGIRGASQGRSDTFDLQLAAGADLELSAVLSSRPARLEGQVKDSQGAAAIGLPVGLAAVEDDVNRRMGGGRLGRTDGEGKFRFDGLAPGDYRVIATPGLETVMDVEAFGPGGTTRALAEGEAGKAEIEWIQ